MTQRERGATNPLDRPGGAAATQLIDPENEDVVALSADGEWGPLRTARDKPAPFDQ